MQFKSVYYLSFPKKSSTYCKPVKTFTSFELFKLLKFKMVLFQVSVLLCILTMHENALLFPVSMPFLPA